MIRKLIAALCLCALLAWPADARMRVPLMGGNRVPSWVLSGAAVDLDFANNRAFGCTFAACLSITRASNKTNLLPSSVSGFSYTTFGNNVLAITPGSGLLIEEARTNQLLNSAAPATQTTGSLANGTYTLWVNGSGSAQMSLGTGVGCGVGTAANGTPVNFTISTPGTCIVTVIGSLNFEQLELGAFGTSGIVTAGATATRAADNITLGANLTTLMNNTSGQVFLQVVAANSTLFPVALSGNTGFNITLMEQSANTSALTWNGSVPLTATFGSGGWTTGFKGVESWAPSSRTLVINNGTEVSDANVLFNAPQSVWNLGNFKGTGRWLDTAISRMTFWTSPSAPAARKALTQ
jgi:hypothetical protein